MNSERLKISSDFIFPKLILFALETVLFLLLTDYKRTGANELAGYVIMFVVIGTLLYYLFTRPEIYYDDENLYISKGTKFNAQVSFAKIQSIKLSVIGIGQGSGSYIIKYLNENNEVKSVRLYLSIFSNPTSKFIEIAERKNPKIKISQINFGINEFFDWRN